MSQVLVELLQITMGRGTDPGNTGLRGKRGKLILMQKVTEADLQDQDLQGKGIQKVVLMNLERQEVGPAGIDLQDKKVEKEVLMITQRQELKLVDIGP